jgi:outer membrane protein assembly factor BamB
MKLRSRFLVVAGLAAGAVGLFVALAPNPRVVADDAPKGATPTAGASGGKSDHNMFGNSVDRNFVNLVDTGISAEFPKKADDDKAHEPGSRIKWKAQLGSRAYGGPIVAGGKIFVGTNNENPRNKRDRNKPTEDDPQGPPLDKSVLMCFDEKTGDFQWQMVHDKLESGIVNDWAHEGLCSTPTVLDGRVYYCSNRCEVMCLDAKGFLDGQNDGFQNEKYKDKTDGDVIWHYSMIDQLKVFPHNMTDCSPLIVGDLVFVITANGVDEGHINIPAPEAPSFICVSQQSGKLIWKSNLPGRNIMHGQWSNASYAVIGGKPQVLFPGGDGWLYGLEPETGKMIWKFDANPKDAPYELGQKGTRSDFIGSPVIYKGKVYIGTGQDPEHGEGVGHFYCIDPAGKEGDISPVLVTDASKSPPATKPNPNNGMIWHYGGDDTRPFANMKRDFAFGRTMSTACIVDDVLYISELAGYVHCVDANTGKKFWQWDTKSQIWGSCYYVDGKVLVANEDGDMYIFKHDKMPQQLDEVTVGAAAAAEADKKAKAAGKSDSEVRKADRDAYDDAIAKVREQVKGKYLLQKVECGAPIRSTPVVANGVLYVMTENALYAINPK